MVFSILNLRFICVDLRQILDTNMCELVMIFFAADARMVFSILNLRFICVDLCQILDTDMRGLVMIFFAIE